jgi:type II secretory pathway pseudopilin PulG
MKKGHRPGQTLVEVVMATLIAAMTTTAVFSVILSSFVSGGKADKRDAAAMVLRRAQEALKSYVSVEPTSTNLFGVLPARPGAPGSPVGHWAADASGAARWALASGPPAHNISSLLTGTPLAGPSSSFQYTVSNTNCLGPSVVPVTNDSNQCKTVTFTLIYPD